MPENIEQQQQTIDFRVYIGIIFFRWQIIVLCFLYCLLGGVLYLQVVPKKYRTTCKIDVFSDRMLTVSDQEAHWTSLSRHINMLENKDIRDETVRRLSNEWGEKVGSRRKMFLDVAVAYDARSPVTLKLSVTSENRSYGAAFLSTVVDIHKTRWRELQRMSQDEALKMLREELANLTVRINEAEDEQLEYQRLHDLARIEARGSAESQYLSFLVARRSALNTELMLLEAQYPKLKDSNAAVISDVHKLTRETTALSPATFEDDAFQTRAGKNAMFSDTLSDDAGADKNGKAASDEGHGWQDLRVRLVYLEKEEKELGANVEPSHPRLQAIRKEIKSVKDQLEIAKEIEFRGMQDRHKALVITRDALEAAEYKWQAKHLMVSKRQAELRRIASKVGRFENNYQTLYSRLHDLRVSEEINAERFYVSEPVETDPNPVWPDPMKVLLVSLALGLGSGFGVALGAQVLDNKVQSIKDVESTLGIGFLGGVPYWVRSGLDSVVRPIVTEEHSTGAIEAYRVLRTSIIAALNKINEKIVFVTSADSREGKTLTTLNTAIVTAQMNKKVLLVDLDLRRGRLHRSLDVPREPGISDAIKNGWPLREVIRETRIENLDLVPAGATIENASELLQSCDLGGMFVDVQDEYDYIFIDTSPVLRVTDTVIAATQGFGVVVYVARVNRTPKPMIRYSLDMLKDARILGLIMNSIEMHKISSLYYTYQYPNYAYYSNAYAYGYDHYYSDEPGARKRRRKRHVSMDTRARNVAEWFRRTFLPLE